MREYIRLQYQMIFRKFQDAGIQPYLGFLLSTMVFAGVSIYLFFKTEFAEYIYLLIAMTYLSRLSETRRNEFLKICFGDRKLRKIRVMENLICAVPFLIFLLLKWHFAAAGLLMVLAISLALANFNTSLSFTLWTPFSKKPFEFTTGLRNTFYVFLLAYTLSAIATSVDNFNLGVFALFVVFATCLSFYTSPENEYYVWIHHVKASAFLINKIKTAVLFSTILALPIALILSIVFPQNIWILLICLVIGWAFLISIILSKYSIYPEEMNLPQGVLIAMCILFPPLLLVFIPYLFKKSESRLSSLLK